MLPYSHNQSAASQDGYSTKSVIEGHSFPSTNRENEVSSFSHTSISVAEKEAQSTISEAEFSSSSGPVLEDSGSDAEKNTYTHTYQFSHQGLVDLYQLLVYVKAQKQELERNYSEWTEEIVRQNEENSEHHNIYHSSYGVNHLGSGNFEMQMENLRQQWESFNQYELYLSTMLVQPKIIS